MQILSICEVLYEEFLTALWEKPDKTTYSITQRITFNKLSLLGLCRDLHYPEERVKQVRLRKQFSEMNSIMENIFVVSDGFILEITNNWESSVQKSLIDRLMQQFGDNYSVFQF